MFIEYRTGSKFGELEIVPTEATHVNVRGNTLVIHGVSYHAHGHYHLWQDGGFHLGLETEDGYKQRQHLYISRQVGDPRWKEGASESARAAIHDQFTLIVNQWAKKNPQALTLAEQSELERKIDKLAGEIADLTADISQKQVEMKTLSDKLAELVIP